MPMRSLIPILSADANLPASSHSPLCNQGLGSIAAPIAVESDDSSTWNPHIPIAASQVSHYTPLSSRPKWRDLQFSPSNRSSELSGWPRSQKRDLGHPLKVWSRQLNFDRAKRRWTDRCVDIFVSIS